MYVYGDGSSTFSYREKGVVVECAKVEFDVLPAPINFQIDRQTEILSFNSDSDLNKIFKLTEPTEENEFVGK